MSAPAYNPDFQQQHVGPPPQLESCQQAAPYEQAAPHQQAPALQPPPQINVNVDAPPVEGTAAPMYATPAPMDVTPVPMDATPIYVNLGIPSESRHPVVMTCPTCRNTGTTQIRHEIGGGTWAIGAILCLTALWPCALIPCCSDSCKDVEHRCSSCGVLVGVKKLV